MSIAGRVSAAQTAYAPERQAASVLDQGVVASVVAAALSEDVGAGDITSLSVVRADQVATASIVFKQAAVVAGMPVLEHTFKVIDPRLEITVLIKDGGSVNSPPSPAAVIRGSARSILTAERTALNFVQRLSGVATTARAFAQVAGASGIAILDTRKTTPGLRHLEKYAVKVGGGVNHRSGLFDAVLIKDNHVRLAGGVTRAVALARRTRPADAVEVETTTLDEVAEAVKAGVDAILLDNMSPETVRRAIELISGKAFVEVSGGINLTNIEPYLIPGVDAISVGALTHSAKSVDISLEVEW